jgi:hypothetical protein
LIANVQFDLLTRAWGAAYATTWEGLSRAALIALETGFAISVNITIACGESSHDMAFVSVHYFTTDKNQTTAE